MPKEPRGGRRGGKAKAATPKPKRRKKMQGIQRASAKGWYAAYLSSLAHTGVYQRACDAAGKDHSTIWRERQANPDFARQEDEALKISARLLEGEAVRRAIHGLRKYKFSPRGEPVMDPRTGEQYYELEYSDTLLVKLLGARIPEVFREKVDVAHTGNTSHVHMTLEEFRQRMKEARE